MKKRKFDGSTNLEQALGIMPIEDGELLPIDDDDDDIILTDLIPLDDDDLSHLIKPDQEIHDDIADLYDRAVTAFDDNMDSIESMEPKYVSRAMEVNKGYLDTALEAVKLKQRQKEWSDKMTLEITKKGIGNQQAKTINNNIIVSNRNDILKRIRNKGSSDDDKS